MILSEKPNFSYVPYEPRQEFLEHSRNRGVLIKRRRKLDGGVIPEPLLKGTQNFMFSSIADGDDEWKPESFAVSGVQAVETREVLAASSGQRPHFLLGGRILRQGTVARLFAGKFGVCVEHTNWPCGSADAWILRVTDTSDILSRPSGPVFS